MHCEQKCCVPCIATTHTIEAVYTGINRNGGSPERHNLNETRCIRGHVEWGVHNPRAICRHIRIRIDARLYNAAPLAGSSSIQNHNGATGPPTPFFSRRLTVRSRGNDCFDNGRDRAQYEPPASSNVMTSLLMSRESVGVI